MRKFDEKMKSRLEGILDKKGDLRLGQLILNAVAIHRRKDEADRRYMYGEEVASDYSTLYNIEDNELLKILEKFHKRFENVQKEEKL